jgi:2'-5' RNA ligase
MPQTTRTPNFTDPAQWLGQQTPSAPPRKTPLQRLTTFAEDRGLTITSTTGGTHNPGSKHPDGKAIDFRTKDQTPAYVDEVFRQAESLGYRVRDERQRPPGQKVWGGPHGHLEYTPEVEQFDKFSDPGEWLTKQESSKQFTSPDQWLQQQPKADTPKVIDLWDGESSIEGLNQGRTTASGEFILKAPDVKASDGTGDGKRMAEPTDTIGAATHGKLVEQGQAPRLSAQALANPGVRDFALSIPGSADRTPTDQELAAVLRRTLQAPDDYNLHSMEKLTPEYLQALQQAGHLRFEPEAGQWQWNVRVPEEVIARIENVKAGKPAEAMDDLSWQQLGNLFAGELAQEAPDLVAGLEGGGAALAKTASNVGKLATLENPQTAPENSLDEFAQKLSTDAAGVRQLDPSVLGQLKRGLLTGAVTMPMINELAVAGGMPAILAHGVVSRAHLSQDEQLKGLITDIGTFGAMHAAGSLPGAVQAGIGGGMQALGGITTGQVKTGEDALAEFLQGVAMSPAAKRSSVEDIHLSPLGRELKRDPYASPADAAAEEAAQLAYLEARQTDPTQAVDITKSVSPKPVSATAPVQEQLPFDTTLSSAGVSPVAQPKSNLSLVNAKPASTPTTPAETSPVVETTAPVSEGFLAQRRAQREARRADAVQEADAVFANFAKVMPTAEEVNSTPQSSGPVGEKRVTEKTPREFSSTQVDLAGKLAKKFKDFGAKIPDSELTEDGREDQPHITVKFGLHDDVPDAVRELLAGEKPITAKLGKISIFPAKEGSDFDVVKVDVESPDLHRLNQKIADARPVTDTHPEYKPHVTIAYVKPGEGKKYVGDTAFEGQEISFDSVTFSGKNREKISVPLNGKPTTSNGQLTTESTSTSRLIAHSNPALNGKPVLAQTQDGRVIVANTDNKSGVSIVQERPIKQPPVTAPVAPGNDMAVSGAQTTIKQKIGAALEKAGIAEPVGKTPPPVVELNFGVNPMAAAKSIGKALQSNINDTSIPPGYDLRQYAQELRTQVTASIKAGRLDPTWTQSMVASVRKQLTGQVVKPSAKFTTSVQKHLTDAFDAFNQGDGPGLARAQRELASLVQTPRHKFLADITRPLMLGTELSMVGIQGGYNLITHPVITARAAVLGLKSAKTNSPSSWLTKFQQSPKHAITELLLSDSSRGYDELTQAIRNHSYTKRGEKSGLELDTQMELDASVPFHERTEGYASSAIRKLPLWRQTERFGKVFMDAQRLMLFEKGAKILEGKGKTLEKNPDAFQELARSINIASGRGQFGDYKQVAKFLTNFGTSPRLIASQFQLLNPKEFVRAYKADPSIAKAKLADVAKVTSFTLGLMGIASSAGWDVRLDPDDPQFGMAKKPNSDYAISILPDGLRPQLKFVGRIIKNFSQVQEIGLSGALGETGKDAMRYLRGKSAPLFSAVIDQAIPYQKNKFSAPVAPSEELKNRPMNPVKAGLETLSPEAYQWLDRHTRWGYGTDFLNRPETVLDSVTGRLTPIYWNTVYDVFQKEGLTAGEKTARLVPEFFGKSTSDFAPTFQRLEFWSGELNAEMHKHQLKPSVSQLEGEARAQYQERAARAQQMLNEYGEKLLRHNLYQQAKPEQQAAMLRLLEDRITDVSDGQANKKRPDLGKLAPSALQASVAQGEYQKKREAVRRQQENVSLPTR